MKTALLILAALALTGCRTATTVTVYRHPSGSTLTKTTTTRF